MFLPNQPLLVLEQYLRGYEAALWVHGVEDAGSDFLRPFGAYLHSRFNWSVSGPGPLDAIQREVGEEQAWDRFFELVADYQAHLDEENVKAETREPQS